MKYIVKNCDSYMLGMCVCKKREACNCAECNTCVTKQMVNEVIEYQDYGRIEYLLNAKNLSDRGRLAVKILKILDVEEVKGI